MPPSRCPSCGRFLKGSLVAALAEAARPCPGCSTRLTVDLFRDAPRSGAPSGSRAGESAAPAGTVLDDVLAGWDTDGTESSWRDDQPPLPADALWVAGAATAGALLGALVSRGPRGSFVGGVLGAGAAAVARKVWRLEP